jgi:ABC-type glycerol-3-phosphate transport system substrate-binding protein
MKRIRAAHATALVAALALALVAAAAVAAANPVGLVDTLGAATPASTFPLPGSGGYPVDAVQQIGPRFTLAQPTRMTEIGAIVNA